MLYICALDRSITLNFSERLQRQKANTINSWTLVFCIVIFLRLIHGLLHDHMLLMQKRLYLNESVYNNRESVDSSSYSNRKQWPRNTTERLKTRGGVSFLISQNLLKHFQKRNLFHKLVNDWISTRHSIALSNS